MYVSVQEKIQAVDHVVVSYFVVDVKNRKAAIGSLETDSCNITVMYWDDKIAVCVDVSID